MPEPPDFSSSRYWSTRFESERSFEWLVRSEELVPLIVDSFQYLRQNQESRSGAGARSDSSSSRPKQATCAGRKPWRILHLGCGTSTLGQDVQTALQQSIRDPKSESSGLENGEEAFVLDTDYVVSSHRSSSIPFEQCDILDPLSLKCLKHKASKLAGDAPDPEDQLREEGFWDMVIDKSTADAISCGPSIPRTRKAEPSSTDRHPLEVMAENLGGVVMQEGIWICVSYSEARFDGIARVSLDSTDSENAFIGDNGSGEASRSGRERDKAWEGPMWRLEKRVPLTTGSNRRVIMDGDIERVVYEPESSIWMYVLRRI